MPKVFRSKFHPNECNIPRIWLDDNNRFHVTVKMQCQFVKCWHHLSSNLSEYQSEWVKNRILEAVFQEWLPCFPAKNPMEMMLLIASCCHEAFGHPFDWSIFCKLHFYQFDKLSIDPVTALQDWLEEMQLLAKCRSF